MHEDWSSSRAGSYDEADRWRFVLGLVGSASRWLWELQRALDLKPTEVRGLVELWDGGPASTQTWGERMRLSRAAATVLYDRLESQGYVERRSDDDGDRRRSSVHCTDVADRRFRQACRDLQVELERYVEAHPDNWDKLAELVSELGGDAVVFPKLWRERRNLWRFVLRLVAVANRWLWSFEGPMELGQNDLRAVLELWVSGGESRLVWQSRMGMSKAGTTTLHDRLERAGLVVNRTGRRDRRQLIAFASERADARFQGACTPVQEALDWDSCRWETLVHIGSVLGQLLGGVGTSDGSSRDVRGSVSRVIAVPRIDYDAVASPC